MKTVVISNLYPPEVVGGYELACAQMVGALQRRGLDVTVLTSAARDDIATLPQIKRIFRLADIWNRYAEAKRPPAVQLAMEVASRFVDSYNIRALVAAIEAGRPDVAYLHNLTGLGGLGIVVALQHLGVPWVWQLGDAVPSYCTRFRGKVIPALAAEYSRQIKGTYVAVSSRVVEELRADGIELNGRVEVLPNWVDGSPSLLPDRTVRRGPLRVVSGGRLTPYKGIDALIEAVGIVKSVGFRVELDLFGAIADVDETHYPSLIDRFEVQDRVRFCGPLEHSEMIKRYQDYEVYAFPTWAREPFGLGPLEALAHGGCLPLISERCGIAEWLVHGVHCLKIKPTAPSIAEAWLDLLEWRIDPGPIVRRGSAMAWRDFQIDSAAERIEELLRDAAQSVHSEQPSPPKEVVQLARLAEGLAQALVADAA